MKRTIITTVIIVVVTLVALGIFNKAASKEDTEGLFAEAIAGKFEIAIATTGELVAEKSIEIKGPEITTGRDVKSTNIKITDLIPEGTEVKEGDYVATLDRTEFENNLKDAREYLTTLQSNLEMALLDTSVQMNSIRDQITNQVHIVFEAEMTLRNSEFESPPIKRQAEINYDQARRVLDQLNRSYTLREAQTEAKIKNMKLFIGRIERRISDYEELLKGFIIKAPSSGMIIYKRDRFGKKRKTGGMINAMDRVVATLPDLTSMISKVFVSEIDITKVEPGQQVAITIDAFPTKSYNGIVTSVANIGEKLPNTDSKVFEVLVKINGSDPNLRPTMTTNNKILIRSFENVVFVPDDCVHTGTDSIPFVYTKSGNKQVIVLGESNDKHVIIEEGLKAGTVIYQAVPDNPEKFNFSGEKLIRKGSK